jgi:hypothetical protein
MNIPRWVAGIALVGVKRGNYTAQHLKVSAAWTSPFLGTAGSTPPMDRIVLCA